MHIHYEKVHSHNPLVTLPQVTTPYELVLLQSYVLLLSSYLECRENKIFLRSVFRMDLFYDPLTTLKIHTDKKLELHLHRL